MSEANGTAEENSRSIREAVRRELELLRPIILRDVLEALRRERGESERREQDS